MLVTTADRPRGTGSLTMWIILLCFLGLLPLQQSSAFLLLTPPPSSRSRTHAAAAATPTTTTTVLFSNTAHSATTASQRSSSSSSSSDTTLPPVGSHDFETWATSGDGAQIMHPAISHALFPGGVRGLTWNNKSGGTRTAAAAAAVDTLPKEPVLRIPQAIVLSSVFDNNENWDVDLACTLWEEMQKGANSRVAGYCQWLRNSNSSSSTSDNDENCPPSTAPHALRRWTEAQKQILTSEPAGAALLELSQRQETAWRNKYQQLAIEKKKIMSWEQFEWAMEVVHSRAFQGVNAGADSSVLSIAAPVVAAIAGYTYRNMNPLSDTTPIVLGVLAVLAVLPTLLLRPKSSAVLLPLIDSANHLESADSSILFDPLGKTFDLTIGPACLDTTSSPTTQLYISYGPKGDRELLLNYGFLPNVKTMEDNLTNDEIRKRLAAAFLQRNK